MASPASEQSDKSKKYDRQLRLWGDHGQSALENANVCLINATGLGTEILKSLVLPGIGAFTIVDDNKVREEHLESNFFLETEHCGKSRAEVSTQLLLELNPDVDGDYVEEDVETILQTNPSFFTTFTVVIGVNLTEKVLTALSSNLWPLDIPFMHCISYGFIGYIRIQVKEHCVVESHPDNQQPDLRLDRPFPAFEEFVKNIKLKEMTLKDHAHVPYLVVLAQTLAQWQETSGSKLPKNWKEKEELRNLIREARLKNDDGVPEDEENFEEAVRAVNSCIIPSSVPASVRAILDDDACVNLTCKSNRFWIMAKALRDFLDEHDGLLPVSGSIPDMTADTNTYIQLQQIYQNQARQDADWTFRRAQQLLHQLNVPAETIMESDVRLFCRHARNLHLMRGTSIEDEYLGKNPNLHNIVCEVDPPGSLILYYGLLRGVSRFQTEVNNVPGEMNDHVEPDTVRLKAVMSKLTGEWGWPPLAKDDYIHEMSRYGGCGCAAQEVIKLVTKQYKPLNNTFIYDAINSTSATFVL